MIWSAYDQYRLLRSVVSVVAVVTSAKPYYIQLGLPILVYRILVYRDNAINLAGINTSIVLFNTVVFGITI